MLQQELESLFYEKELELIKDFNEKRIQEKEEKYKKCLFLYNKGIEKIICELKEQKERQAEAKVNDIANLCDLKEKIKTGYFYEGFLEMQKRKVKIIEERLKKNDYIYNKYTVCVELFKEKIIENDSDYEFFNDYYESFLKYAKEFFESQNFKTSIEINPNALRKTSHALCLKLSW